MPDLPHDRCPPIELLSVNQVRWSLNHDHHWYEVATHPPSPFSPGLGLNGLTVRLSRLVPVVAHRVTDATLQGMNVTVGAPILPAIVGMDALDSRYRLHLALLSHS